MKKLILVCFGFSLVMTACPLKDPVDVPPDYPPPTPFDRVKDAGHAEV